MSIKVPLTRGNQAAFMRSVCLLLLVSLQLCSLVHGEFVFMIPNHHGFSDEHFGVPVDVLLRGATRVYNYSDLIVSVPSDWEHLSVVREYIRQKEEIHAQHSKRSNGDELWQQVHLHTNQRQRWLHDGNFTEDVMVYVSALEGSTTNSWGLDRIDQQRLTAQDPLDGQYLGFDESVSDQRTVHFYVIDTGVSTHPAIPQTISYDFSYYPNDPPDCNGHGTHVAGIAMSVGMGVSPGHRHVIHSIKVLDCFGMGDTTGVLAGLSWVKANFQSPAVINLSIGIKGISSSLSTMIKSMHALGIAIVGAAGNQADNACLYFPAGITSSGDIPVVGVGALQVPTGLTDTAASFSNWGSCVRAYTPGDKILSTLPGDLVGKKSGTSMSSPFFAGAVILALATDPSLTAIQAQALVLSRLTMGTVTGANVFSGTNNVLWVPPALSQPVIPPSLATTTTSVASSTTLASTTNSALTSTTSVAQTTLLSGTTTAALSTSTRATTSAATAAASTTRTSTTSAAQAVTSTNAAASRTTSTASTSTKAATTAASSTSTSTARATTSALTTSTRATTSASASTQATTTRAASTASTTAGASGSTTSAARTTSIRATTSASASTQSTSTHAASTSTASIRATTSAARTASTRATTSASTSTHATSTRAASTSSTTARVTTSAAHTTSTRATATVSASIRATTTAARSSSTGANPAASASTQSISTPGAVWFTLFCFFCLVIGT